MKMEESSLNSALRHFEATEANLVRAEQLLESLLVKIPKGIAFVEDVEFESDRRHFVELIQSLPKLDGWKPEIYVMELDEVAQIRLDTQDLTDFETIVRIERQISEPSRQLREYRYRFTQKRRLLVRDALLELVASTDALLRNLNRHIETDAPSNEHVDDVDFDALEENIAQIGTLLGSSMQKPSRWGDLHRHLHFRMLGDLSDIIRHDWPSVKSGLQKAMYGEKEPMPVGVEDLGALVSARPRGTVATKLQWAKLTDEDFERLLFILISGESGYENPEWLMKTNAPDRGRDLSVVRVHYDRLAGCIRQRVIIQCKHWQSRSVCPADISALREQMKLWEPPRVDVHVIATSGRFSADAVSLVEKMNLADSALRIEIWPESHLERLLASRPVIIAEFDLR